MAGSASSRTGLRTLVTVVGVTVIALVLAWLLLLDVFRIAADSMAPALRTGDRVVVLKPSYGLRLPFAGSEVVRWAEPRRGEVILFRFPLDESRHYVKRVIAVPGDTIEVRGTEVIVNGKALPRRDAGDADRGRAAGGNAGGVLLREQAGDADYLVRYFAPDQRTFSRNSAARQMPADHFFVLGDNRDGSDDSRSWGPVPRSNIEGAVLFSW